MKSRLKHWFYPHEQNNHHPKALRHPAITGYVIALLLFHLAYTTFFSSQTKVLGFATAISQPQLIQLTNQQRLSHGLQPLTESPLLDKSALLKAQNMFKEDYWAHYAPSGKSPWYWFDQVGYTYTLAGENLARDFDTSAGVINGWMNSPSHRANLLGAGYKDIGIAVLNGTLQGEPTTLVVQHFGTPVVLSATSQASTPPPSTVTTTTKQPPAAPSQTPVQSEALAQEQQLPTSSGNPGVPASPLSRLSSLTYQLLHPAPIQTWGIEQTVTVLFLFCLMLMFVFDSTILYRKGLHNHHSHPVLHAGLLGVLIILVLYSTVGGIL